VREGGEPGAVKMREKGGEKENKGGKRNPRVHIRVAEERGGLELGGRDRAQTREPVYSYRAIGAEAQSTNNGATHK